MFKHLTLKLGHQNNSNDATLHELVGFYNSFKELIIDFYFQPLIEPNNQ